MHEDCRHEQPTVWLPSVPARVLHLLPQLPFRPRRLASCVPVARAPTRASSSESRIRARADSRRETCAGRRAGPTTAGSTDARNRVRAPRDASASCAGRSDVPARSSAGSVTAHGRASRQAADTCVGRRYSTRHGHGALGACDSRSRASLVVCAHDVAAESVAELARQAASAAASTSPRPKPRVRQST